MTRLSRIFLLVSNVLKPAVLAASHRPSPSVVYITLSDITASSSLDAPAVSLSTVYVTLGLSNSALAPLVTTSSHIMNHSSAARHPISVLHDADTDAGSDTDTGSGTVTNTHLKSSTDTDMGDTESGLTYFLPHETGSTVKTGSGSTGSLVTSTDSDVDPITITDTVTVTQNVTFTASNTDASTSIYLPVFTTTSSHRHHFFSII